MACSATAQAWFSSQQRRSDPSRHPARGPHRVCARPRRPSSPLLPNLVFSTHRCKMAFNSMDWRRRAEEMRKIADQMRDRHAKQTMLGIADDYELLAGQFEYLEKWQYGAADIAASARPIVDDDRLC